MDIATKLINAGADLDSVSQVITIFISDFKVIMMGAELKLKLSREQPRRYLVPLTYMKEQHFV